MANRTHTSPYARARAHLKRFGHRESTSQNRGEYRIAGNFGEGFNLAIWRIFPRIAKFKSANIKN